MAAPAAEAAASPDALSSEDRAFDDLLVFITPLVDSKRLTSLQVVQLVNGLGLPHLGALASRPDLIPAVRAGLEALL
jgi:hypothetical protein